MTTPNNPQEMAPILNSTPLQFLGFLNTPPLWNQSNYFEFQQIDLPKIPVDETAIKITIPNGLILGKRIEHFFRYYINNFSEEEVLASNIQIVSEKITIGEFDFILKNHETKQVSHIEVVFKYYLYDPDLPNELERWIGPNRKDSLVRKLSALKHRQFPLLYRKETKVYLEELEVVPQNVVQKVCFKASLFVPYSLLDQKFSYLNNECIMGYWIKFNEFSQERFGKHLFYSPKKQDWPIAPQEGKIWYTYSEISEQIHSLLEKQRSPLLWMKKDPHVYERLFMVWW